jgi:hypothetical protein
MRMLELSSSAQTWPLLLAAAGVGALVSTVGTLVGQRLERAARRRELLVKAAIDLAERSTDRALRIGEINEIQVQLQDSIVSAETYYQWLLHLFEHARLPDDPRLKRLTPRGEGG